MTGTYVITNATNSPPSFTVYQLYKLGKNMVLVNLILCFW